MKSRNVLIGLGVAAALAAGVGVYGYNAVAQGGPGYGPGWMMGGGYGPGYHMRNWGGGQGPGPEQDRGIARPSGKTINPVPPAGKARPQAKVMVRVITCAIGAAVTAPA